MSQRGFFTDDYLGKGGLTDRLAPPVRVSDAIKPVPKRHRLCYFCMASVAEKRK